MGCDLAGLAEGGVFLIQSDQSPESVWEHFPAEAQRTLVAKKTKVALDNGLLPISCVGETLEEREGGKTMDVVGRQVDAILNAVSADEAQKVVIAYEPVWAIGTGKTAEPADANRIIAQSVRAPLVDMYTEQGDPSEKCGERACSRKSSTPRNSGHIATSTESASTVNICGSSAQSALARPTPPTLRLSVEPTSSLKSPSMVSVRPVAAPTPWTTQLR